MTKIIEQTIVVDVLKDTTMALSDTSKKIRYLVSQAPDANKAVSFAYNKLKEYGVHTKEGGEIRYQHVRNVTMTKLSSK